MIDINRIYSFLIICIVGGSLIARGIYFPGIGITPAFLVCLTLIAMCYIVELMFIKKLEYNKDTYKFIKILLFLISLVVASYLVNGLVFSSKFILVLFSILFGIICIKSIENTETISQLLNFYLFISLINVIVEIGQASDIKFFIDLWAKTNETLNIERFDSFSIGGRYMGLSNNPVNFGYNIAAALSIALFYDCKYLKKARLLIVAIFIIGLWLTQMRSALIWGVFIITCKLFFSEVKRTTYNFLFKLVIVLVLSVIFGHSFFEMIMESRFVTDSGTSGTLARIPMILTAFNHAIYYPLGMAEYVVEPDLVVLLSADSYVYSSVINNAAHNVIGNTVGSFGFIGLALVLKLYYLLFLLYRKINTSQLCAQEKSYFQASFWALCSCFVNSMMHNANILGADFSSWLFIGILISYTHLKVNGKLKFME